MSGYKMREYRDLPEETEPAPGGRGWAIAGIVCGVLALLIPIIFGPAGIILGIVGRVKGAGTIAIVAIVVSVVCAVAGAVLGVLFVNLAAGGGG